MIYRQVGDTSFLLDYAGVRFLIDPVMEELKGGEAASAAFSELLDVDAVIATHLSESSFDRAARRLIPRGMKVFVQNEADEHELERDGFSNVEILGDDTEFQHLWVRRIPSFRYCEGTLEPDPKSCGVIISHPVLNSVYIAGESVWYDSMKKVLKSWKPRLVVVSAGYTGCSGECSMGMRREDIAAIHLSYPRAKIIAGRYPSCARKGLCREELRLYVEEHRLKDAVLFPKDGEEHRL